LIVRLIFINRFFYPDHSATSQMLTDLAFALASEGQRVTIITSQQLYDKPEQRLPAREVINGADIRRIRTSHFGRHNLLGRAVDYATFYLSAAFCLLWMVRAHDIVIAKTDPPMLSVIARPVCALRGARLVNWSQDMFPEVAAALGVGRGGASRLAFAIMRWLRDGSLKGADANVVIGSRMAERVRELGVTEDKVHVIPNWADGGLIKSVPASENELRKNWGLDNAFVVAYSGNLGRAHDYHTFLDAAAWLEQNGSCETRVTEAVGLDASSAGTASAPDNPTTGQAPTSAPRIKWLFIGGGARYAQLKQEAEARGLTSLRFEPYQPRESLSNSLSVADVHIVSLRPAMEGLIVPSKLYGIMAAGRPTIFVGDLDGEIARLVRIYDCGIAIAEGEAETLARTVLAFAREPARVRSMGERARQAFEANFDIEHSVAKWRELFDDLAPDQS
jgi:colanic acid biosynthesis glycosyl transferase WcaI